MSSVPQYLWGMNEDYSYSNDVLDHEEVIGMETQTSNVASETNNTESETNNADTDIDHTESANENSNSFTQTMKEDEYMNVASCSSSNSNARTRRRNVHFNNYYISEDEKTFSDTDSVADPEYELPNNDVGEYDIERTPPRIPTGTLPRSPAKTRQRKTWETPERHLARDIFKTSFQNLTIPSFHECAKAIQQNKILKHRTPSQLRAWIAHQIKTQSVY